MWAEVLELATLDEVVGIGETGVAAMLRSQSQDLGIRTNAGAHVLAAPYRDQLAAGDDPDTVMQPMTIPQINYARQSFS